VQTAARELVHGGCDQLLTPLGGGNPPARGLGFEISDRRLGDRAGDRASIG
jgi:hypothetical protein